MPNAEYLMANRFRWLDAPGSLVISTLILLYSDVFSGVIRYASYAIGLPFLAYVPMLMVIVTVAAAMLTATVRTNFDLRIWGVAFLFAFYAIYSLAIGRSPEGVAFSLYAWSPFFLGMLLIRFKLLARIMPHIPLLLIASIVGVFINAATPVPWASGDSFTIGGIEVSVVKEWVAFGVTRLPGFSRASTTAANDITLFLLWVFCTPRPLYAKLLFWAASAYAVVLTTSKTPMLVVAFAPIVLIGAMCLERLRTPSFARTYSYVVMVSLLLLVIVPPFIPDKIQAMSTHNLAVTDVLPFFRMESFTDRVINTWPDALHTLEQGTGSVEAVFGRGIGGIGIGQQFTELHMFNSADNLHVFMYVTFGIASYLFYAILIVGHGQAISRNTLSGAIHLGTLLGVLGLGTLTSVVEAAIPVLAFGMLISTCLDPRSAVPQAVEVSIEVDTDIASRALAQTA